MLLCKTLQVAPAGGEGVDRTARPKESRIYDDGFCVPTGSVLRRRRHAINSTKTASAAKGTKSIAPTCPQADNKVILCNKEECSAAVRGSWPVAVAT